MKCLLIFALISIASAQLGNECSVGADCGRGQDLICAFGKCVKLEPAHRFLIPIPKNHGQRNQLVGTCGDTYCGTGFVCLGGQCVFRGTLFKPEYSDVHQRHPMTFQDQHQLGFSGRQNHLGLPCTFTCPDGRQCVKGSCV